MWAAGVVNVELQREPGLRGAGRKSRRKEGLAGRDKAGEEGALSL